MKKRKSAAGAGGALGLRPRLRAFFTGGKNRKTRIAVLTLAALLLLSVAVFAFVTWVRESRKITASTDKFVVSADVSSAGAAYYTAATLSAGDNVFRVDNRNTNGNDGSDSFDIIIMPSSSSSIQYISSEGATRYSYGVEGYSKYPDGAVIYTGIACADGANVSFTVANSSASDIPVNIAVVRHTSHNLYVGSTFDLELSSQEYYYNFGVENYARAGIIENTEVSDGIYPFISKDDYAYLYIVSSFTLNIDDKDPFAEVSAGAETFVYNVPAYINLLYSNVTLADGLEIKHGYSGLFSVDRITGRISNDSKPFSISAPNAYYRTENGAAFDTAFIVTSVANFTKSTEAALSGELLEAVEEDAVLYIGKYLRSAMYSGTDAYYTARGVPLPATYYNYGITYSYSSSSAAMKDSGAVVRGSANSAPLSLTATALYNGTSFPSNTYTHPVSVIGTDGEAMRTAYADVLGHLITDRQPAGAALNAQNDMLVTGIDIKGMTDGFIRDTGISLDSAVLSTGSGLLQFEVVSGRDGVATEHEITLSVTAGSTGVSGYNNVTSVNIKRDSVTPAGTDTVTLSIGGSSYGPFSVSFLGSTIEERDKCLEASMPQIYIDSNVSECGVLNIGDNGMFLGSSDGSGQKLTSSNIGVFSYNGKYIDYGIYFMNSAACNALEAAEAYCTAHSLTREQRYELLDALYNYQNTSHPGRTELDGILAAASISGIAISDTYNSTALLGGADAYFSYSDGVITKNIGTLQIAGGFLALVGKVTYTDKLTNGVPNYYNYIVRMLYSPSSGLGGTSETSFTEGNNFDDVFTGDVSWVTTPVRPMVMPAQRRLQSVEYTVTSGDTVYEYGITDDGAGNRVTSGNACPYFTVTWNSADSRYEVSVISGNIPVSNSTVEVTVVLTDGANPTSENYTFVIQGIYKYGRDINDIWVYQRMLQTYGDADGYLLSDNAKKNMTAFDCSLATIEANAFTGDISMTYLAEKGIIPQALTQADLTGHTFDLTGAQYLINTRSMSFDGLGSVTSLDPFFYTDEISLETLILTDCGVTDAMLRGSALCPYPLYKLNKLTSADLSDNAGITVLSKTDEDDIGYLFYRTVTVLKLSGCGLTDITGIGNMVALNEIWLDSNSIGNFYELREIETLESAYIMSNGSHGGYYGTHGEINVCNIVALMHRNIGVYVAYDGSVPKQAAIYEKNGSDYYFKNSISKIDTGTVTIAGNGILESDNGYLITLEQEYLSVTINAYFNFISYGVSANNYTSAKDELFPAGMKIYMTETGDTRYFDVTGVDVTADASSETRTYRISLIYGASAPTGSYGYYNVYVTGGDCRDTVYREITFKVRLSQP